MSLFITRARFLVFLGFLPPRPRVVVSRLTCLRPLPRNVLIKRCVDSVTCLDTKSPARLGIISSARTSGDLFFGISVRILPPVRKVSRPKALAPLHRSDRTQQKNLP